MSAGEAEIVAAGVAGLRALFDRGQTTARDALAAYRARIARLDPQINAFVWTDVAAAEAAAAAADARRAAGETLSPLDGVPIAVKANIALAGAPWHAGVEAYADRRADADAEAVARLRAAGAVILGLLNLHEGALGATNDNAWLGRCHNPYRHGFTPGGSSGGSGAAVAARLCAAALGTDTMGSVRLPAAYCGVCGHKPTPGRVPDEGVVTLSWTLDHVGPIARSPQDLRVMMGVLAGAAADPADPPEPRRPAVDVRIGWLDWAGQTETSPDIDAAFVDARAQWRQAGGGAGSPTVRLEDYGYSRDRRHGLLIAEAEANVVHEEALADRPGGFSQEFRNFMDWGAGQSAVKLARAHHRLRELRGAMAEVFERVDLIATPTVGHTAFSFDDPVPAHQADFTALANFAGLPATAVPMGLAPDGLPMSIQFIGPPGADARTLAAAEAFVQRSAPLPGPPKAGE